MTRYEDSDVVRPVCTAHRPARLGIAEHGGLFAVAARFARRNFAKRLPACLLESGTLHIQRNIGPGARLLDGFDDALEQGTEALPTLPTPWPTLTLPTLSCGGCGAGDGCRL